MTQMAVIALIIGIVLVLCGGGYLLMQAFLHGLN
jgi:hypothetical protein